MRSTSVFSTEKKERAESEALKLAGTTHKWDSMLAAMDDGLGIPMQQRQKVSRQRERQKVSRQRERVNGIKLQPAGRAAHHV